MKTLIKSENPLRGGFFTVGLLDEPRGWRTLQAMAQREIDPQKLARIIDQMNRLLDWHEKMAATCPASRSITRGLDVHPWQLEL